MAERPRYLVVGSDGTIGHALLQHLPPDQVLGTTRRVPDPEWQISLDLTQDLPNWQIPHGIQVLINCAVIGKLEVCKRNPEETRRINVDAAVALAEKCHQAGVFFIHLSTDKVFAGDRPRMPADAPFAPVTEYGRQKADAERPMLQMLAKGASLAIIRLTKVLVPGMALFRDWRDALLRGEVIHPFSDMTLAPVRLPDVIEVVACVARDRHTGIFQMSGERDISYAEAAYYLADQLGVSSELVQPLNVSQVGLSIENVPLYTSLDMQILQERIARILPSTWDAIHWTFQATHLGVGNDFG